MGMFDNYDTIYNTFIGNNKEEPAKEYKVVDDCIPSQIFDIKGNFVGYQWQEGNTFDLTITANNIIKVKEDSIIFNEAGVEPTDTLPGYAGQQAYNTKDNCSWTCSGLIEGLFVWIKDKLVTYDANGTKPIELEVDMEGKKLTFNIIDFKGNIIESFYTENENTLVVNIDEEISEELEGSVYIGTVIITSSKGSYKKEQFALSVI